MLRMRQREANREGLHVEGASKQDSKQEAYLEKREKKILTGNYQLCGG